MKRRIGPTALRAFATTVLFWAVSASAFADTPPSLIAVLSQQAPNAMAWTLAPLDRAVPEDIRQNLMLLREGLLDEGTGKSENALDAYRFGHQLCNNMIAALDERDKALVRAGVTNAQANANVAITSQALEARRSGGSRAVTATNGLTGTSTTVVRELSSWTQYLREGDQREELRNQANSKIALANERPKVEWAERVTQLRTQLDGLYAQFRGAMRKDTALVETITTLRNTAPAATTSPVATVPATAAVAPPASGAAPDAAVVDQRWFVGETWASSGGTKWSFEGDGSGVKAFGKTKLPFSWRALPSGFVEISGRATPGGPVRTYFIQFKSKSEALYGNSEATVSIRMHKQ